MEKEDQIKVKFSKIILPLIKAHKSFEAKALFDDIAKEWLVAIYFNKNGRLESLVFAQTKKEEVAKEVAEFLQKLIDEASPPKRPEEILKI